MHYYTFNIGDYASHTMHLEPLEDLAYRRMIDWLYLNEKPLPNDIDQIARLIRMRSHCECIATVLREFFICIDDGFICQRVEEELEKYRTKSSRAKQSAEARWSKKTQKKQKVKQQDANAMRTHSERNANQEPITNNQEPLIIDGASAPEREQVAQQKRFKKPSVEEVRNYMAEQGNQVPDEADRFFNYHESKGWKVSNAPMKDWKAAARYWLGNQSKFRRSGNVTPIAKANYGTGIVDL